MKYRVSACARRAGFTLIELSIVLAVLGLLVGGILGGIALRKGAELNSVSANAHAHIAAIQQFRQQYGYYPGDFPQAVKIWGKADGDTDLTTNSGNCAAPATDAASASGSCNGDGNGIIDAGINYEYWRAWQQLGLAGLIAGKYTGVAATVAGTNEPTTNYQGSAFTFYNTTLAAGAAPCSVQNCVSATNAYDGDYSNALYFGAFSNSTHTSGAGTILSGEEAYSVDRKFDDGLPALGGIRSWKPALLATCTVGSTSDSASTYLVSGGSVAACSLIFMNSYRTTKTGIE